LLEYYELEPFGSHVEDLRMGMIASTIANVNRDVEATPEPFAPMDFVPWGQEREPVDVDPIDLDDDKQQSDLIRAAMFGLPAAM
jgi:hypothetical protein